MRTLMNTICCNNMRGMCCMLNLHIYQISECDVFVLPKK